MMLWLIVILTGGASFGQYEIEKEGIRISVQVEASIYRYEVHNLNLPPIISFEIQPHHAYNFEAPENWTAHEEGGIFEARAVDVFAAILSGQQRSFSMRVTSAGAILGEVPLELGFERRDAVAIKVWGPVPSSPNYLLCIVAIMTGIVLVHTGMVISRERRLSSPTVT